MKTRQQLGFTIIELLVTITVAMIVLGIGIPSFATLIRNNESAAEINELASALSLARSEAVARGADVLVVPASGTDWTSGWYVGMDADGDGTYPDPDDPVLRTYPATDALNFTAAPVRVTYESTGEAAALATFTIVPTHCDNNYNKQRTVSIALAGYVDLTRQNCPP